MKTKLTPQVAYLVGLWKHRHTRDGVGVTGGELITEIFIRESLRQGIAQPDRIILKPRAAFFYHTAYLSLFEKIREEQLARFAMRNEYSSNFVAGLFDSTGLMENAMPVICHADRSDELMLLRLGFRCELRKGYLRVVKKAQEFLDFVKPNLKLEIRKGKFSKVQ